MGFSLLWRAGPATDMAMTGTPAGGSVVAPACPPRAGPALWRFVFLDSSPGAVCSSTSVLRMTYCVPVIYLKDMLKI
ncbi:hypothetical protein [Paludibacterium yongneupense]|uniref:hypothetical protein n=1 Tax=Paludibacterium yongneupense TaxID=400061 RepID=UPI0004914A79|nr:hypothetical protein [Paludibacterium yongneupense]